RSRADRRGARAVQGGTASGRVPAAPVGRRSRASIAGVDRSGWAVPGVVRERLAAAHRLMTHADLRALASRTAASRAAVRGRDALRAVATRRRHAAALP